MQTPDERDAAVPAVRSLCAVTRGAPRSRGSRGSRGSQRPAAHLGFEDLPSYAVELIAHHVSTPSTPAACLLPLVSPVWGTAVDSAQLLVDIDVDLGPRLSQHKDINLGALSCLIEGRSRTTRGGAAAAAAAVPAALLRGRLLAAWLGKHRGSVRSLRIPGGSRDRGPDSYRPGWVEDLVRISKALTARQRRPAAGPALPHLVRLELPVLGPRDNSAFLKVLATCTSLQHLRLGPPHECTSPSVTCAAVGAALAPLQQLRTLHLEWPHTWALTVEGACLAGLLQQLPPSLEEVQLVGLRCCESGSISLSCITHLVRLRAWELWVPLVVKDGSSSVGRGAAELTALTSMRCERQLQGNDARLQLPNLCFLELECGTEPATWQELQGMMHLRQLKLNSRHRLEDAAGLGGVTQLQHLQLRDLAEPYPHEPAIVEPWVAAIPSLTRLKHLSLPIKVLLAGGPTLLTPLVQLEQLIIECFYRIDAAFIPEGAHGLAATAAGAAVEVVGSAVGSGWGPLQRLVLLAGNWDREGKEAALQAAAVARAASPGLAVDVI